MQAMARMLSVVSSARPARRRLIRNVRPIHAIVVPMPASESTGLVFAQRVERLRETCVSTMSSSKWRRLLTSIHTSGLSLPESFWSFLRDYRRFSMATPEPGWCSEDGSGIRDIPTCGPFLFRDVLCVFWPSSYRVSRGQDVTPWLRHQDTAALYDVILSAGQFDVECDGTGLTLWAYRSLTQQVLQAPPTTETPCT